VLIEAIERFVNVDMYSLKLKPLVELLATVSTLIVRSRSLLPSSALALTLDESFEQGADKEPAADGKGDAKDAQRKKEIASRLVECCKVN